MFHQNSCKPKAQVLPAQCCPTQQSVRERNCDYIVPVIHPSHTTNVVNHRYNFQHSYPHTESTVNRVTNQHFNAGPGQQVAGFGPGQQVAGFGPDQQHGCKPKCNNNNRFW